MRGSSRQGQTHAVLTRSVDGGTKVVVLKKGRTRRLAAEIDGDTVHIYSELIGWAYRLKEVAFGVGRRDAELLEVLGLEDPVGVIGQVSEDGLVSGKRLTRAGGKVHNDLVVAVAAARRGSTQGGCSEKGACKSSEEGGLEHNHDGE